MAAIREKLKNPVGTHSVTIKQSELLSLDADGGLWMVLQMVAGKDQTVKGIGAKSYSWHVKDLYLEVRGKRLAR